jgi:hypothetical protein
MKLKMTKGEIRRIVAEEVHEHYIRKTQDRLDEAAQGHRWDIRIRPSSEGLSVGLMKDGQFIDVRVAKDATEVSATVSEMLKTMQKEMTAL